MHATVYAQNKRHLSPRSKETSTARHWFHTSVFMVVCKYFLYKRASLPKCGLDPSCPLLLVVNDGKYVIAQLC